jgi:hypothetical protein
VAPFLLPRFLAVLLYTDGQMATGSSSARLDLEEVNRCPGGLSPSMDRVPNARPGRSAWQQQRQRWIWRTRDVGDSIGFEGHGAATELGEEGAGGGATSDLR